MKTRCTKCRWIHEADSTAGTSFHGVELCNEHATAPELLEALRQLVSASVAPNLGRLPGARAAARIAISNATGSTTAAAFQVANEITEAEETERGQAIIRLLALHPALDDAGKRFKPSRVNTEGGTKTALGLYRTIADIVNRPTAPTAPAGQYEPTTEEIARQF